MDHVAIVIDTLGSAAGFIDGNSSSEAQRVMDTLRRVNVATGALILLVDHFGKAVETGVTGAIAKAQSANAVLGILADNSLMGEIPNRRMAVAKMRGGAGGAVTPFRLRQVNVGDAGGSTCVINCNLVGGRHRRLGKNRHRAVGMGRAAFSNPPSNAPALNTAR